MSKKQPRFHQQEPIRWQAPRMDNAGRQRGVRNIRKQKKGS